MTGAKSKKSKNQLRRERQKQKKQETKGQNLSSTEGSDSATTATKTKTVEESAKQLLDSSQTQQEQNNGTANIHTPDPRKRRNSSSEETAVEAGDLKMMNAKDNDNSNGKIFESDIDKFLDDPNFQEFKKVLNRFYMPEDITADTEKSNDAQDEKGKVMYSDDEEQGIDLSDEDEEDDKKNEGKKTSKALTISDKKQAGNGNNNEKTQGATNDGSQKLSKRKYRKMNKIPLSVLKAEAQRPDAVEWYDVDAPDPRLLIYIKCLKNAVPVPRHWQFKKEYLSSKRGIEKPPFELPQFIKDTGIVDMRDTTQLDPQSLKQKVREKVQPKMGKLDLDYGKLHDAFFKYQTKPKLLGFGDVYYEGREHDEIDIKGLRPGKISSKLREALGLPENAPPPWIMNMQRFGPPPSYPGLKIPELDNLYSGVAYFANGQQQQQQKEKANDVAWLISEVKPLLAPVEKAHWGQLKSAEEDSEDEEDEEEEEDDDEDKFSDAEEGGNAVRYENEDDSETEPAVVGEGEAVPITSMESTGHSSAAFNRAQQQQAVVDDGKPKRLYEVLEEQKGTDSRAGFRGGHSYKIRSRDAFEEGQQDSGNGDGGNGGEEEMAAKRARYENQKKNEFKF